MDFFGWTRWIDYLVAPLAVFRHPFRMRTSVERPNVAAVIEYPVSRHLIQPGKMPHPYCIHFQTSVGAIRVAVVFVPSWWLADASSEYYSRMFLWHAVALVFFACIFSFPSSFFILTHLCPYHATISITIILLHSLSLPVHLPFTSSSFLFICISYEWRRGDTTGRALDLRSTGRGFKS